MAPKNDQKKPKSMCSSGTYPSYSRLFCPTLAPRFRNSSSSKQQQQQQRRRRKKFPMNRFQIKCANRMINVPFAGRFSPQFYTPVATVHHQRHAGRRAPSLSTVAMSQSQNRGRHEGGDFFLAICRCSRHCCHDGVCL